MRALVVGLGHMGSIHRKTLRSLGYMVDTVDPRPEAGATYATTKQALLATKYDVAAVAVPAPLLAECAFELAGIPMLVEKPFATSAREGAMLGAYLTARGRVCVGFQERFNYRVLELQERIGHHGVHVRSARFVRHSDRSSTNIVHDLLTHDVDLARHLFKDQWGNRAVTLCTYDVACSQPVKARRIELEVNALAWGEEGVLRVGGHPAHKDQTWVIDLMDHDVPSVTALWHAFLMEKAHPGPDDAVLALLGAEEVAASQNGAHSELVPSPKGTA